MTVYADNMRRYAMVDRGSGRVLTGRWSHLMADDPAELAGFAARLGLSPEWIQFPGTGREHYDIVEAVRRRAVAAGAVPITYPRDTGNLILTKRLQASALHAASRAWHVFPLRPGSKTPAIRDWEHQATTYPERIRDRWTVRLQRGGGHVHAPHNLGIACGPSGLVVIDLDVEKPGQDRAGWPEQWLEYDIRSGAEVLAALADRAWQTVPETYVVATSSGGRHLYFTAPAGVRLRNSAGHLGPMIDIRGEGGYVVAAGSHLRVSLGRDDSAAEPSELGYRLVEDCSPAALPGWLTAAIAADRQRNHNPNTGSHQIEASRQHALDSRSDSYVAAALRGEVDRVRSAPVGQRNHTLNTAAYSLGQLVAAGALDQGRAVEALTAAAGSAGLEMAEIAATIDSGLTAGAKRPRAITTTSGHFPDTRDNRADDPTRPLTDHRPEDRSDAAEDQHSGTPRSLGAELPNLEQPPATEPDDTNANTIKESDGSVRGRSDSAGGPVSEVTVDDSGVGPADQVAPGSADLGERARADQTGPDWADDTPSAREAANAMREAVRAVAEGRNGGNGSVDGEGAEQLTDAAYAALDAWTEPPSDLNGQAEASDAPSDEPGQVGSLQDARPAAVQEQPFDGHAALDQAIEHARAAVAHLEAGRVAVRDQSGADALDAVVHTGRPAYWAEVEVDL